MSKVMTSRKSEWKNEEQDRSTISRRMFAGLDRITLYYRNKQISLLREGKTSQFLRMCDQVEFPRDTNRLLLMYGERLLAHWIQNTSSNFLLC